MGPFLLGDHFDNELNVILTPKAAPSATDAGHKHLGGWAVHQPGAWCARTPDKRSSKGEDTEHGVQKGPHSEMARKRGSDDLPSRLFCLSC